MTQQTTPSNKKLVPIISWQAPEYYEHERSKRWYFIAGIITFTLVFYFLITGAFTAAIAFIVLAGAYLLAHRQENKSYAIEINELGIKVGKRFFLYAHLQSFWIVYDPPNITTLNLLTTGNVEQHIEIQLGEQDPTELRDFLRRQIPEVEGKAEGLWNVMCRMLKL